MFACPRDNGANSVATESFGRAASEIGRRANHAFTKRPRYIAGTAGKRKTYPMAGFSHGADGSRLIFHHMV
jgi:hypothetical protein